MSTLPLKDFLGFVINAAPGDPSRTAQSDLVSGSTALLSGGSGVTVSPSTGAVVNTGAIYQNSAGAANFDPSFNGTPPLPNIGGPFTEGISTAQVYTDSGPGNIFQLAAYVNNTGSRATVALFGFGKGNHVWGANIIGYTQAANDTAIGIELDFGIIGAGTGAIAFGLVIAAKGGLDGGGQPNAGPYIQWQASANANTLYGIRSHVSSGNQAVATTGTLWLNDGTQSHNIGLDWSGTTFTDAAVKLAATESVKIGGRKALTRSSGRQDQMAAAFLDGIPWYTATINDPAPYNTSTSAPASGTVWCCKLPLLGGDVVTNLGAICSNVGSGITHLYYMLVDPTRHVLAVTPDMGASITAALMTGAMQDGAGNNTPQTIAADGDYYMAVLAVYTTTAPAFRGVTGGTGYTNLATGGTSRSGNSTTGLADKPAIGTVLAAITGNGAIFVGGAS